MTVRECERNRSMQKKCENCEWWDNGLCDRCGRLTEEDDECVKWKKKGTEHE